MVAVMEGDKWWNLKVEGASNEIESGRNDLVNAAR